MNANAISQRLRYAIARRGYSQTRFPPVLNAHLQRVAPHAKPIAIGALSRICTGKRPVNDFELIAFASALNKDVEWLLARGTIDPDEGWGAG